MWNLRLQPELGVGSTSGDLKSELGCRLAEWLCSGGAGSGSAAQSLAATHQETRLPRFATARYCDSPHRSG